MRKIMILLIMLLFISLSTQSPVAAQSPCRILVNSGGAPASGAFVQIYQGGQLVSSGNTDSDGVFRAYPINQGSMYTVAVNWNGRSWTRDIPLRDPTPIDILN